jgi:hypothetical protein
MSLLFLKGIDPSIRRNDMFFVPRIALAISSDFFHDEKMMLRTLAGNLILLVELTFSPAKCASRHPHIMRASLLGTPEPDRDAPLRI